MLAEQHQLSFELNVPDAASEITVVANLQRRSLEASMRSEEHTSELQSLMRSSYAVFCLKKKNIQIPNINQHLLLHDDTTHSHKTLETLFPQRSAFSFVFTNQ